MFNAGNNIGATRDARLGPLLAFGLALLVYLTAALIMRPVPTGDEPHYLLYADTLAQTGKVDLRQSYASGSARQFSPDGLSPDGHAFDYRDDGRLISVHGVGLPVLIAPVIYLTDSTLAVRLEMVVFSALAASQLFLLLRESGVAGPRDTWLAFGATALSMPFLVYANQIYPDVPAALLVVYAARVVVARQPSTTNLLLAALAAAALPWLHVRYLVLTAGCGLAVLVRFRQRSAVGAALLAGGLMLASLGLLAVAFAAWYGSPLPTAPYAAAYDGNADLSPPSLPDLYFFGLGAFLDPESGWLPFAPVQVLGIIGLAVWARRFPRTAVWALVFVGGYLLITTRANGVGQSFPARYFIPVVLLVALPLALALRLSRLIRFAFAGLLIVSIAIDGMAVLHYRDLYPRSNTAPAGRTVLPIAANLQSLWPRFQAPDLPTGFRVTPDQLPRRTGRLTTIAHPGQPPAVVAYAAPGRDPVGFLSYGPYAVLQAGSYRANFMLAAAGQQTTQSVVILDVRAVNGRILARTELHLADFPPDRTNGTFAVPFTLADPETVETRVYYAGQTAVWLGAITVTPVAVVPSPADSYPDWPISLAWVSLIIGGSLALLWSEGNQAEPNARRPRSSSDPAAAREAQP
ncbi:MAG TPA: hypothetical protein VFZ25_10340 [Chloroflexota bacterium]|nr:hypothetical protein [Chloroflexota bacterium]